MNWQTELIDSAFWVLKAFAGSVVFLIILGTLLVRFTHWGRQFWRIGAHYLNPKTHFSAMALFGCILLFTLLDVRLSVVVSNWYNKMYGSLQDYNADLFWYMMAVFAILATINVVLGLVNYYLSQRFIINWRTDLNHRLVSRWLHNRTYYKTYYSHGILDNPDQRIQQDVQAFVTTSLSFSTGLVSAVNSIIAFTILLWGLSGPLTLGGVAIPHAMVFLTYLYVLLTSVMAFKLGRPLIKLNFLNEKLNANFRYSLIRVKEYAESIAFYRGERSEKHLLTQQFNSVIENVWHIVFRTLKFSGFNLVVGQASVVFPFLIQAGRFFQKQISLGDLMQTGQVFGQLHSSLSFFRNSYDTFASYKATLDRLTGFSDAMQSAEKLTMPEIKTDSDRLVISHLSVFTPSQKPLIENLSLDLPQGAWLLIQGPSGVGKTTLLRSLAGLWAFAQGDMRTPANALFLSQKPYLPQGRLLDALHYPNMAPDQADYALETALLTRVQLGHLTTQLLEDNEWTQVLSLGEQQRLAFARVLLHRPQIIYLDEASASMDEGLEDAMYRLLKSTLPNSTVVSVGHRSTLHVMHERHLFINKDGSWQLHDRTLG
ncbi:ABC transporter ATP-binding protein/permease [Pasteurellaceae bacterium HPA106]|uniref:ABC transporter ATP-binding protein/permease n=1 Tax=Spirabiliibacterium pneumoniae TaxID=221400 RepID=UPI001AAD7E1D|nr:ABC transporter ATP-binding protein/permease [Spirabiliibacterium pneumoniae]MBE2895885.1 ABC transporter ATP-binding protein/permease [Spirabiliibacterium pneumoniae]